MKKENKKIAQKRRALERKKQEQRRKIKKFFIIFIPVLVAVILAAAIIWDAVTNKDTDSAGTSTDTEQTSDSSDSTAGDGQSSNGSSSDSGQNSGSSDAQTGSSGTLSSDTSLTVADGDTVNIDYVGTVDGVEFDGGSTNGAGADLTIGSGTYIDGFEEQLVGAHPGDTVEVNVTFPAPYSLNTDLSGKAAVFTVTVNGIYQ